MAEIEEAFPIKEEVIAYPTDTKPNALKKYADEEKKDFFNRVNKKYPIEDRPSFKALISGKPRNINLINITAKAKITILKGIMPNLKSIKNTKMKIDIRNNK